MNVDSLRGRDLAEYIVTTYGFSVYPVQSDGTPLQNCDTCRSRSVRYRSGSLSCTACVQGFGEAPELVEHFVSAETMWCHGSHSATARPDKVKDFWPTDAPPAVALAPSGLRVVRVSPQMEEPDLSGIIDYAGMERTLVLRHSNGTRSMIYMGYGPATTSGPTASHLQLMHTCSAFLWDGRIVADYPVSHMQKSIYGSLQECDSLLGPCSCSGDYHDSNQYRYSWQHCPESPDTHPGITNCRGSAQVTDDVPRFELEADLVNWLVRQLSPFFEIQRQVSGKSIHGKTVRLDPSAQYPRIAAAPGRRRTVTHADHAGASAAGPTQPVRSWTGAVAAYRATQAEVERLRTGRARLAGALAAVESPSAGQRTADLEAAVSRADQQVASATTALDRAARHRHSADGHGTPPLPDR
ncbi:hypothetical protein [Streptomyces sp. NBC_00503]|uniref:hypothetical protein n=1 Tax=Streptomyces sp. NBC_00503 TaxID=2903659 RepID=UPI002E81EB83|nr:hypothetical protein [Streptomyces sp. NBC_00503]WUD85690.1 hypothetical protein OG490_36910 [Streptomyces sp. NBC_00503]